jgi:2-polyprenyl-6-methoxyphenol hydroxylase-like FAD-dependent oxidoreductase
MTTSSSEVDVLIVGAGPTGLALAAQLQTFGARFRIIDRLLDRTRESRALTVQARTLELLQTLGLGERLVARGKQATRLKLHLEGRPVATATIGEVGAVDTRFPFILFVSQAATEEVLNGWLRRSGVTVERGTELVARHLAHGRSAPFEFTLVRPDGYIAFRSAGRRFDPVDRYLAAWYVAAV